MAFDDSTKGIERCGSPLELELAKAFSRQARFQWRKPEDHPWEVGRWPGWFLTLLAQPHYDRYRPDFSISTWAHEDDDLLPFVVVVEVDGHDYHERTKEQAEYDKRRDRFMTSTEARVFRFTGREVYRDADACACEILEYVIKVQQDHLDEDFIKFIRAKVENDNQ